MGGMDAEQQFAEMVVQEAKRRGLNVFVFMARENATFHFRTHTYSSNPLVIQAMRVINDQFALIAGISGSARTAVQERSADAPQQTNEPEEKGASSLGETSQSS